MKWWRGVAATVVAVVTIGVFPGLLAGADGRGDDFVHVREALQAETTYLGWARYEVDGSYSDVVWIPGTQSVLAIDTAAGTLVRVDIDTNEITVGPILPAGANRLLITPEGRWVYAIATDTTMERSEILRIAAADLVPDVAFNLDGLIEVPGARIPVIETVQGDESLLIVSTRQRLGAFRDGVLLPRTYRYGNVFETLVGFDGRYGYGRSGGALWGFEIEADGVTDPVKVLTAESTEPIPSVAGENEMLYDGKVFAIPSLESRPVTERDTLETDPTLPLAYASVSDFSSEDNLVVLDEESLEPLTTPKPCRSDLLIGGGLSVSRRGAEPGSIVVTDLLRLCGAYGDFHSLEPDRIFDSRSAENGAGTRLAPKSTTRVKVHGRGGVPLNGVESVVVNVTAIQQQGAPDGNFVTVWPAGFDRPTASNLNLFDGQTIGNQVTVSTAAGGFIDVYNDSGTIHLTVDVMGYYSSSLVADGARYQSISPRRVVDSRQDGERIGPGQDLVVSPRIDLERDRRWGANQVVSVVVNVTAIRPTEQGFIRAFALGARLPDASSMNFEPHINTARLLTVPLGDNQQIVLRNDVGSTHVAVDVVGLYVRSDRLDQEGRFVGLVPERELDTRLDSPFEGAGQLPTDGIILLPGYRERITLVTNMTAVRSSEFGFLSGAGWRPEGGGRDLLTTSSLNFTAGSIVANQAYLTPGAGGEIAIYNAAGNTHVLLDLFGFFTAD